MVSNNSEVPAVCTGKMARLNVIIPYSSTSLLETTTLFTCIFNGMLCPLIVLGNILVLVAILRKAELRHLANTSILLLALSDISVGAMAQPAFVVFLAIKYETKETACEAFGVYTALLYICVGLSCFTLIAITLERYLAIFQPYWYVQHVTQMRVILTVLCMWTVWVLHTCSLWVLPFSLAWFLYRIVPVVVVSSTFVIAVVVYWKVFKLCRRKRAVIRCRNNSTCTQDENNPGNSVNFRETKTSKTVSLVTGSLFLCYSPFFCTLAIASTVKSLDQRIAFHMIFPLAETALFLNSLLNPLIYVWRSKDIRDSLREAVRL